VEEARSRSATVISNGSESTLKNQSDRAELENSQSLDSIDEPISQLPLESKSAYSPHVTVCPSACLSVCPFACLYFFLFLLDEEDGESNYGSVLEDSQNFGSVVDHETQGNPSRRYPRLPIPSSLPYPLP